MNKTQPNLVTGQKNLSALACCLFLLLCPSVLLSQEHPAAGIHINSEIYPTGRFKPAVGINYQFLLDERNAVQTGLNFRTSSLHGTLNITGSQPYPFEISRKYLSTFALFKHYFGKFSLAGGPTLEYLLSWSSKQSGDNAIVSAYDESPDFRVGFLTTFGREFRLSRLLVLEPQLRFGNSRYFSFDEDAMLSVGLILWLQH